jgi:hypothetical protein
MKKGTVNTLLILGAAAAAFFVFTAMRRRRSSVEAGSPIKITEEEFQTAEVVTPEIVKPKTTVLDIVKSLKRSPEKKEAAKKRKALKKQPKAQAAIKTFLTAPRAVRGMDDVTVIY